MKSCSFYLIALNAIFSFAAQAQTITPIVKADLPSVIDESSGIEVIGRNNIWSHNDSGGDPELYNFDSTGTLTLTLTISNASNVDWEELARDSAGNFYIGDFGNNNNDRNNLRIYKLPNPAQIVGNSVTAQIIHFSYPDQNDFPPAAPLLNFDMESFFWFNHSLYLFSKNRTNPYDGYTHLYRLPEIAGTYTATLLDSFYLGSGPYFLTSATSADISPDGNTIALLSGAHIHLFSNFSGEDFFGGTVQELDFSEVTQKEALVFINDSELYLTDESNNNTGQKLYYLNLASFLTTPVAPEKKSELTINVSGNPFYDEFTLKIKTGERKTVLLSLTDISGKTILQETRILQKDGWNTITLGDEQLLQQSGSFFLSVSEDGNEVYRNILVKLPR